MALTGDSNGERDRGQKRNDVDTPTPRCARCGDPFLPEQNSQKYCSTRCREAAKKRRQRFRLRRGRDAGELLVPPGTRVMRGDGSLTDPGEDLREFSDSDDRIGLDDEPGECENNTFFSDAMRVEQELAKLRERYQEMARPLLAVQARNPGVRLPALVELELEYESKMTTVLRAHERVQAVERAARRQPEVQVRAAERQLEQAALNAFGRDLPGGSRRYHVDEFHGRDTMDIAAW